MLGHLKEKLLKEGLEQQSELAEQLAQVGNFINLVKKINKDEIALRRLIDPEVVANNENRQRFDACWRTAKIWNVLAVT